MEPGELLTTTLHRIGVKAERRAQGELVADLKRVTGKPAPLFKLAAALAKPDGAVSDVVCSPRWMSRPCATWWPRTGTPGRSTGGTCKR